MPFPRQLKKIGVFNILCVSIKWNEIQRYFTVEEIVDMMNHVSKIYSKCSRNLFHINFETILTELPKQNIKDVQETIKKKFPDFDYYVIVNPTGSDHSGNRIANLKGVLVRTCCHEIGHLLGLRDAGKYDFETNSFDQYGDNLTFMGRYASNELTAPALYKLGWIPKSEVVLFRINGKYRLKNVMNKELHYYSCVIVQKDDKENNETKDFYISYQDSSVCLHIGKNGLSQKIKQIGSEPYKDSQFTDLYIDVMEKYDDWVIVSLKKINS